MEAREIRARKQKWIPKKERVWLLVAVLIAVSILVLVLNNLLHMPTATLHSEDFEDVYESFGSIARIILFFVLAYYVLLRIIKLPILKGQAQIKKWLSTLLRLTKRWHTPAAIIAIAFIILHAVAVFMHGFEFEFNDISGLLALLVLLPVPILGLLRYRRLDRKWHLRTGLAFAILFLIHSFL